jgi:uncharacterized membrane-anchored protein
MSIFVEFLQELPGDNQEEELVHSMARLHLERHTQERPESTLLSDTLKSNREERRRQLYIIIEPKVGNQKRDLSSDWYYFPEQLQHLPGILEYGVMDQIRKCECHFDVLNAFEFLERVNRHPVTP